MLATTYDDPRGFCTCQGATMVRIKSNSYGYWNACRHCGLPVEDSYVEVADEPVKIWRPRARDEFHG